MLTLNELKHKLLFTQNIRRMLESRKMIAAINSKKYIAQLQCANALSHSIAINHLVEMLNAYACNSLNIIITAKSGLCGNFVIDLNKAVETHIDTLASAVATDDMSDMDDVFDYAQNTDDDADTEEHEDEFEDDEIYDTYADSCACTENITRTVNVADEKTKHYWILIGNKIPDNLKNIKLYNHVQIESDMMPHLLILSEHIYKLKHKINKINIISWSSESSEPYLQVLDVNCSKKQDKQACKKSNLSKREWYNMFMLQCYSFLNAKLTASLVREEKIRFLTMDQAINNADDMTHQLRNDVNQMRQSVITSELIEIITGAEFA